MKLGTLNRIYHQGIVAIMRADSSEGLLQAGDALHKGGVTVIEVTMTTPGALSVIEQAVHQLGDEDVCFGAGSVIDAETARLAILAGARFIVTPTLALDVIQVCNRYGVVVIVGSYTPTEIKSALEHGADLVKLFPASHGGPSYMKAVQAPLPQAELVPTGGITLQNAAEFLQTGAFALGVGGSLVNKSILSQGDWPRLTETAHAFREIVKQYRSG